MQTWEDWNWIFCTGPFRTCARPCTQPFKCAKDIKPREARSNSSKNIAEMRGYQVSVFDARSSTTPPRSMQTLRISHFFAQRLPSTFMCEGHLPGWLSPHHHARLPYCEAMLYTLRKCRERARALTVPKKCILRECAGCIRFCVCSKGTKHSITQHVTGHIQIGGLCVPLPHQLRAEGS